jgi:hypothetical protein
MARSYRKLTGLVLVLMLILTACSTSAPPLATPTSVPASDCEADAPDCGDAIPAEEPGGTGTPSIGMPVDGGLTVSEALNATATGVLAMQGFVFNDGSGAKLCEALAESFPPQCGGASIAITGYEGSITVPLVSEQGVSWTDLPVTLFGEIVDGTFVVDPTVSG